MEKHIQNCESWHEHKGDPWDPTMPEQPWDVVGTDILTLPTSHQDSRYDLVYVDKIFVKWS